MTALELVGQWFARHQEGVSGDQRFITLSQLQYLRGLAEEEDEYSQQAGNPTMIQPGSGLSFVWTPAGNAKYVITEGRDGRRNTISKLLNLRASGAGSLF